MNLIAKLRSLIAPAPIQIAESRISTVEITAVVVPTAVAPGIVAEAPVKRDRAGHLGMQGYRPLVTRSFDRAVCEGCKEPVRAGVRHVCIYNAHNYMDTLTHDDRVRLIAQLRTLPLSAPAATPPPKPRARRARKTARSVQ